MIIPAATAEKIYKEYMAVVASAAKNFTIAYPATLLPYPPEKIKQAIKAVATHRKAAGKLDPEAVNGIRGAFVALGKFTAPEDADFLKNYNETLKSQANAGFAEKTKRSQFITNRVRIQEENFVQESRVFFSRLLNDRALGGPGV